MSFASPRFGCPAAFLRKWRLACRRLGLLNSFAFQIAGVIVQGDENADDWVTKYYVQFSDDGNSFTTYQKPDGSSEVSVCT